MPDHRDESEMIVRVKKIQNKFGKSKNYSYICSAQEKDRCREVRWLDITKFIR